jgi:hypothetical protein
MKKTVGNFILESIVESGGSRISSIARHGHAVHRVRITNLSTLPYDVQLEQELPDSLPPRPFSYANGTVDRWTASWICVTSVAPLDDTRDLDVHGPAASSKRLLVRTLHSRLATVGGAGSGFYVPNSSHPLPIDVRLTVH